MSPATTATPTTFFSTVIFEARNGRGLTQAEFAGLCGVSQPAVAQWERGEHPLLETTLGKVAEALGLTLVELLYAPVVAAHRQQRAKKKKGRAHAARTT